MAGVWSKSGHDGIAVLAGLALDEGKLVGEPVGAFVEGFVGEIVGEFVGKGLLDGLGEGSAWGVGGLVLRRGSDFRAS